MNIRPGGSEQRTAIVTGATRGIGAATALALAMRGIAPALLVRDATAATAIADRIRDRGVACRVETCDVADYDSAEVTIASATSSMNDNSMAATRSVLNVWLGSSITMSLKRRRSPWIVSAAVLSESAAR